MLAQVQSLTYSLPQALASSVRKVAQKSLCLSLGLVIGSSFTSFKYTQAAEIQEPTPAQSDVAVEKGKIMPDGVYLYQEYQESEEFGETHMIFEVRSNQVVGSFYVPNSEFVCFNGNLEKDKLALNILNPLTRQTYSQAVAIDNSSLVASSEGSSAATGVGIAGFQLITAENNLHQKVLTTCRANFDS